MIVVFSDLLFVYVVEMKVSIHTWLGTKDTSDHVPDPLDAIPQHKSITWEKLADVLDQIPEYHLAGIKARENAGKVIPIKWFQWCRQLAT